MIPMPDAHLYVLAGGKSSRFGTDKALAKANGETLLEGVINALSPATASVTVVTGTADRYATLGYRSITDRPGEVGPIGGLTAALRDRLDCHGSGWLLLTSCDLVQPSPGWLAALLPDAKRQAMIVAFRGQKWEPMFAFYHTDLIPIVERQIEQGRYALQALLELAPAHPVALPERYARVPQANTPDELRLALRQRGVA